MDFLIKEIDEYHNKGFLEFKDEYLEKIKCDLKIGQRVYWYGQSDLDFYNECQETNYKELKYDGEQFTGIIIPRPYVTLFHKELDFEDCIIVCDRYPIEKEMIECMWYYLPTILSDDDLVGIFNI